MFPIKTLLFPIVAITGLSISGISSALAQPQPPLLPPLCPPGAPTLPAPYQCPAGDEMLFEDNFRPMGTDADINLALSKCADNGNTMLTDFTDNCHNHPEADGTEYVYEGLFVPWNAECNSCERLGYWSCRGSRVTAWPAPKLFCCKPGAAFPDASPAPDDDIEPEMEPTPEETPYPLDPTANIPF